MKKHKTDAETIQRGAPSGSGKKVNVWNVLTIVGALVFLTGLVILMVPSRQLKGEEITVYKSPTCGCCNKWVDHLHDAGFDVATKNRSNMASVKSKYGVKPNLQSCHTAVVRSYVVEGHVPAEDIKRMLQEQPTIAGLAVPGMPAGSPGMEGAYTVPYDVLTFDGDGLTKVYAKH